ncbi:hypothetical protein [Pseudovibrio sp. FO-BEG1]|uniref:hypothetical protein n=1 Tax=Pseudovibrio sp. (strain FO-BEG1) TaxID=911045 RepID=UPI0011D1F871|nr:hypothetical protein [Pseudovibrio sp. FO-BEG1]
MTDLQADIELESGPPGPLEGRAAKQISGIELEGKADLIKIVSAEVKAAVKNNVELTLENASRVKNKNIYTAISKAYKTLELSGRDRMKAWHIDTIKSDPKRFKMVLTVHPIIANSEKITIIKDASSEASMTIHTKASGDISVKFPNNSTASCSGTGAKCLINLAVLNVYINENGNLDYTSARTYPGEKLASALRKIR